MDTIKQTSTNSRMVHAMKHANEKPTLASINLMYAWAYGKKPESGTTYVGMLEGVFEYLDNKRWVGNSPEQKFAQWIDHANEIVDFGHEKYKQELDSVLDKYIGNSGVRKHPISWKATVGKPVKVQG